MSLYKLKYLSYGSQAILIEWPKTMSKNILKDVINFKTKIKKTHVKQKLEIINTYNSLLIYYNTTIDNLNDEVLTLKQIYNSKSNANASKIKHWKIPVCYDQQFGTDLEQLAMAKNLTKSEIIERHSSSIYTIAFIGFLPGFLYLNGLDKTLFFDRKKTPSLQVKKGAVAIGGMQTGIYPKNSPGGWHIIGNTPINLFNVTENPPSIFSAGDRIKFSPIDIKTYDDISKKIEVSDYTLTPISEL